MIVDGMNFCFAHLPPLPTRLFALLRSCDSVPLPSGPRVFDWLPNFKQPVCLSKVSLVGICAHDCPQYFSLLVCACALVAFALRVRARQLLTSACLHAQLCNGVLLPCTFVRISVNIISRILIYLVYINNKHVIISLQSYCSFK